MRLDEYYFKLGKKGSNKTFVETVTDAKNDLGITTMQWRLDTVEKQVATLLMVLKHGGFEALILNKLGYGASRRYRITGKPFHFEKRQALDKLVEEHKVTRTRNGWYKLTAKEIVK